MYRVYDLKLKCWVKEPIYLSMNEDIYIEKRIFLNRKKLLLVSDERYIVQKDIGSYDKDKVPIFEGDIVNVKFTNGEETESVVVTGIIAYYADHATYYIFDYQNSKYYPINQTVCEHLTIIGNIYDNSNMLPS